LQPRAYTVGLATRGVSTVPTQDRAAKEPSATVARRSPSKGKPTPGRTRIPRDTLNKSVIIEAGIAIVERDGLDGLTFQALGDELGSHATSVYRHFRDKDELLLEIIDTLRARSYSAEVVSSGNWRADLVLLATRVREHYLRYAPFAHDMSVRSTHRTREFVNVEFTLAALSQAGLTTEQAVLYLRVIGNYIRAMSSFEAAMSCLDVNLRAKDYIEMKSGSMVLDPQEFPHLVEAAPLLLMFDDPQPFTVGLNAILDAVERLGESNSAAEA
jgi:AcrR family transcriptional regulator